jgi:hypothetical protein
LSSKIPGISIEKYHYTAMKSALEKNALRGLDKLPDSEQEHFLGDLTNTIISCPIVVRACVVSRQGYLKRYLETYSRQYTDNQLSYRVDGIEILMLSFPPTADRPPSPTLHPTGDRTPPALAYVKIP